MLLARHHKKEKAFGPSPTNGYTSGSGKKPKFWQRKPKTANGTMHRDTEMTAGATNLGTTHPVVRPSHDTGYTGSTVAPTGAYDTTPKRSLAHDNTHKPTAVPAILQPSHNDGHRTGGHMPGHNAGLAPGHNTGLAPGHTTGHAQATPGIAPAFDHGGVHVAPTPSGINHNHPYALDARGQPLNY